MIARSMLSRHNNVDDTFPYRYLKDETPMPMLMQEKANVDANKKMFDEKKKKIDQRSSSLNKCPFWKAIIL